jgi:hypothetical protein
VITSVVGHSHEICAEAFGASRHLPGLILALIGLGRVAIDFANTLGGRPDHPDDEYLHNCVVMLDLLSAIRDPLLSA